MFCSPAPEQRGLLFRICSGPWSHVHRKRWAHCQNLLAVCGFYELLTAKMPLRACSPNRKHPHSDILHPTHPDTCHEKIDVQICVCSCLNSNEKMKVFIGLVFCQISCFVFPFSNPNCSTLSKSEWLPLYKNFNMKCGSLLKSWSPWLPL